MKNGKSIVVLLPTHNEEQAIGQVIDEVNQVLDCQIVVADGKGSAASTDRTCAIARRKGARILRPPRGKGAAVRYAFRRISADYVFMLNADYTYPPSYLPLLLAELEDGADAVVGARKYREPGAMSLGHRFGNWCLTCLTNLLFGSKFQDICSGMWGFRGDVVKKLELTSVGFSLEADICTNIILNGWDVRQIPIEYRRRIGWAKLSVITGFKIAWFLIKRRFR